MNNKKLSAVNYQLSIFLITLFFVLPLKAQVNIGSQDNPNQFSILELTTTKDSQGGLRLPQLTNDELTALTQEKLVTSEDKEEAKGLVIYNTDSGCLEFWNGSDWISLCSDILTPPIVGPQTNPTTTTNNDIQISAYVNAMYDFQYQKLTAYLTSGAATAYQWQISKDGATWYDITGATKADFLVPPDFMYSLGNLGLVKDNIDISSPGNNSIEIQFRCQITSSNVTDNTAPANILSMLFIRTNTPDYDIDPTTGLRFLTIQRGQNGINNPQDPGIGTIEIALFNLGQSGTGAWVRDPDNYNNITHKDDDGKPNDAGDLGDFYQWGRVADGHEHIVWSKDASYNITFGAGTSGSIVKSSTPPFTYTAQGQIPKDATDYYGKFIFAPNTTAVPWGNNNNNLWGNGNQVRATAPADLSDWSYRSNNPCPGDWYVPSQFDLWDIFLGNGLGSDATLLNGTSYASGIDDRWAYRANATSGNVIGGVLIMNRTGEQVFLPASGMRYYFNDGPLFSLASGAINSSTYYQSTGVSSYGMFFSNMELIKNGFTRTYGVSIRCVKDKE